MTISRGGATRLHPESDIRGVNVTQSTIEQPAVNLSARGSGAASDRSFTVLPLAAGLLVLAILALILITTLKEAWPALVYSGFDFITKTQWIPLEINGAGPLYGTLSFVFGTVVVSAIALVIAVPV